MRHDDLSGQVSAALEYMNADDRDEWVLAGMSVKSALGEDGLGIWLRWSQRSEKYRESSAMAVWRSIRADGGRTVGSLFSDARSRGWSGIENGVPVAPVLPDPAQRERQRREAEERNRRAREAAAHARWLVAGATLDDHPYLDAKGLGWREGQYGQRLSGYKGLVLDSKTLLVPMRDLGEYEVRALQFIQRDGSKKFGPYGCKTRGLVHTIGSDQRISRMSLGQVVWWCEGYATGLSIRMALEAMNAMRDLVVVAFSAANLGKLAVQERKRSRATFIGVGDHDPAYCSNRECQHRWDAGTEAPESCPVCGGRATQGASQKHMQAAYLPYWSSGTLGVDANDYMQANGLQSLTDELRRFRRACINARRR